MSTMADRLLDAMARSAARLYGGEAEWVPLLRRYFDR